MTILFGRQNSRVDTTDRDSIFLWNIGTVPCLVQHHMVAHTQSLLAFLLSGPFPLSNTFQDISPEIVISGNLVGDLDNMYSSKFSLSTLFGIKCFDCGSKMITKWPASHASVHLIYSVHGYISCYLAHHTGKLLLWSVRFYFVFLDWLNSCLPLNSESHGSDDFH